MARKRRSQHQTSPELPWQGVPQDTDPFRSPFTDQREDAPDNWARFSSRVPQESGTNPPISHQQTGANAWQQTGSNTAATGQPAQPNWQDTGYHMEPIPVDDTQPLNAKNDKDYVMPLPRKPINPRFWLCVCAVAVAVVVIPVTIFSFVFTIRKIDVQGNVTIPDQEIIRLSGVKLGESVMKLDEKQIRDGIHQNSYLVYAGVTRVSPSEIILRVREREPVAYIFNSNFFVVDNRGNLLYTVEDINNPPPLIEVKGIEVVYGLPGYRLKVEQPQDLTVYAELMLEMKALKLLDQIREIDLTNLTNIYLVTKSGLTVHMGGSESIHDKIRAITLALNALSSREDIPFPGTLDVSNPADSPYVPDMGI